MKYRTADCWHFRASAFSPRCRVASARSTATATMTFAITCQHTKLQGEFVLIGRDRRAIHGQARVAIAHRLAALAQVAKNLIVSPVLLDDVNDVLDPVLRFPTA